MRVWGWCGYCVGKLQDPRVPAQKSCRCGDTCSNCEAGVGMKSLLALISGSYIEHISLYLNYITTQEDPGDHNYDNHI